MATVRSRAPVVALNTYAEPESVAPVSSCLAPTTTVLPDTATEEPKPSSNAGVGLFRVATRAPVVALNTYAKPASVASVSSKGAPTATVFPDAATESPNKSWLGIVGFIRVAIRAPPVASNTYADPASTAPVSSQRAPTRTWLPDNAME